MTQPDEAKKPDHSPEIKEQAAGTPNPGSALPSVVGGLKQPRQVRSETLLHGDRELQIIHGDEIYRLSVTRQGKLILHK